MGLKGFDYKSLCGFVIKKIKPQIHQDEKTGLVFKTINYKVLCKNDIKI